jgi:branched-chain amino acid transport system ATP-binding protein
MLKVNNIEVVYNHIVLVLRGISLEVPEGEIVSFLGSNGAGKSTTLKAISGTLRYLDGEIVKGAVEFAGEIIHQKDPPDIVRLGIIHVPEGRHIFREMTVDENLRAGAYSQKDSKAIRGGLEWVLEYFPVLQARRRQKAGYLSGGEQQMLALGRAMMATPTLLMLDEPSLGLAPLLVKEIFNIIVRINRDSGAAILVVEQNANMALAVSSHGYIMENGKIVMDGESGKLRENQDVKEFYLGLTDTAERKSYIDVKHYKRRKRWLS